MEYYSQYNTGKTDEIIKRHQKIIDSLHENEKFSEIENYLMLIATGIAEKNVNKDGKNTPSFDNIEGGPFAAVIVKKDENGRPVILGIGANHVVPEKDPSAHGEMSAIRDATARLGYTDLSGTTLYTSCECCPQCLSSSIASGIKKIVYANDRFHAAEIGFSDEEQYRYMLDMFSYMTSIDKIENQPELLSKLADHDAVILDDQENFVCGAYVDLESSDPMKTLPSMQAILQACKITEGFHLPEGYKLLSRKIPHPASFITADWARIGRIRDKENPQDPSLDRFEKNPQDIVYVENVFEEMIVKNPSNIRTKNVSAKEIIDVYVKKIDGITIENNNNPTVLKEALRAFEVWKNLISFNRQAKY